MITNMADLVRQDGMGMCKAFSHLHAFIILFDIYVIVDNIITYILKMFLQVLYGSFFYNLTKLTIFTRAITMIFWYSTSIT